MRWRTRLCYISVFLALLLARPVGASPLADDRALDRQWQDYLPILHNHFMRYLDLDDETVHALVRRPGEHVRLKLHLDRRGRIYTVDILEGSHVDRFTRACVEAARTMGRLPYLPSALHERGRHSGIEFTFGTSPSPTDNAE